MTERALTLARAGDEDAFRELTEPYRHELQLHCYRIVGSTQDPLYSMTKGGVTLFTCTASNPNGLSGSVPLSC